MKLSKNTSDSPTIHGPGDSVVVVVVVVAVVVVVGADRGSWKKSFPGQLSRVLNL